MIQDRLAMLDTIICRVQGEPRMPNQQLKKEQKFCVRCKEYKSISLFSNWEKAKDKLKPYCKDCGRVYDAGYSKSHAEHRQRVAKEYRARRVANLAASEEHYTIAEWKLLLEKSNYRCVKCQTVFNLSADHIIPLSRGGKDTIDNIQVLCRSCNSAKGNRHATRYKKEVKNE